MGGVFVSAQLCNPLLNLCFFDSIGVGGGCVDIQRCVATTTLLLQRAGGESIFCLSDPTHGVAHTPHSPSSSQRVEGHHELDAGSVVELHTQRRGGVGGLEE